MMIGKTCTAILVGLVGLLALATCGPQDGPAANAIELPPMTLTPAPANRAEFQPTRIVYGADASHFGVLGLPDTPAPPAGYPVVVLVHGGFWSEPWDYTLMSPIGEDLRSRGYATWNIEFRRVGGGGGWPETFDDVGAAIDQLGSIVRDHALNLDRVGMIGHSSGGHLALWALGRADARVEPVTVIGLGAVVDLEAFPQSAALFARDETASGPQWHAAAPALDPDKVLLVHGSADRIVPLATLAPAQSAGVPIVVIDSEDHFDVIDPVSRSWSATIEHLDGAMR